MLFNSIEFVIFLIFVLGLFWIIPHKFRWILLLVASYFFYISWDPSYIFLILFSTLLDYFLCKHLTSHKKVNRKKLGLFLSLFFNLGLLFFFKYSDFFQLVCQDVLALFDVSYAISTQSFLLPIGISFYTFQTLSYSIDVYRNRQPVENHLGKFALYVSFFPQLVAGPIERAKDLLPQFKNKVSYLKDVQFKSSLLLFFFGLFKKVVIADNCAIFVDAYFGTQEYQDGGTMLFATYLFAIQIYCDFSGYSDMAIGMARMMGINLNTNFRTPYFSSSFTKFWRRWHISLSTWMRDYIYIPLGGNRSGTFKASFNILITMLLGGLWHGASYNFIVWGGLNGFFLLVEKHFQFPLNKIIRLFQAIVVFHCICFTWIFFRAIDLNEAISITEKISSIRFSEFYFIVAENIFSPAIIGTVFLFLLEAASPFKPIDNLIKSNNFIFVILLIIIIYSILLLGNSIGAPFIYFRF